MKLIIYTLANCKECQKRAAVHNELAQLLSEMGVDTEGIMFGEINGQRHLPLEEHDNLVRKDNDPMKYAAPVYILEDDATNTIVKLADISKHGNVENYLGYIENMLDRIEQQ